MFENTFSFIISAKAIAQTTNKYKWLSNQNYQLKSNNREEIVKSIQMKENPCQEVIIDSSKITSVDRIETTKAIDSLTPLLMSVSTKKKNNNIGHRIKEETDKDELI